MPEVFLVTGASRGLGRHLAMAVLTAGHRLVAGVRRPADLDDLRVAYPDALRVVALDVTDPGAALAAVDTAVAAFGRLDVLVNNAGYADMGAIEDLSIENFRAQVETNLFGVVNVTKAALPVLRSQGSGHIIQISSVGGRLATAGLSAYQAAKWGVGGFTLVLAAEVAPLGIKVTLLEPGGMRTDWAGSSMTVVPASAPYEPTVGVMSRLHNAGATQAGDPAKVAQLVLQIAAMDEPPLRMLVGSDAFNYATAAARQQLEADEQWRDLSASTDHDDATAGDLDPIGLRLGRS
jgi:NAD(P)-dependent dehydrogenase (short-subunit alcohol dehydrogenase family)